MPLPLESSPDDQRLARYLLGLLSDEETERLDESSIADDDVAWRLCTIENDLVDDYVRGALPEDIVGPFEAHYLSSPRRRGKVRFAKRFVRTVDAERAVNAARTDLSAPSERWFPWRTFWTLRVTVAAAAALVLILGVVGALVHDRSSPSPIPGASVERDRRRATESARANTPRTEAPKTETARAEAPRGITGKPARPTTPARSATMAVVLFPQTRSTNMGSAGDAEPAIAMPREADGLVLELRLDVSDFSRYAASLMDLSNHRTVWRSARVAPMSTSTATADQPAVSITVPASVLASQSYAVELSGVTASGNAEIVAVYLFRIVRGR
jgi:hypothetical protein